MTPERKFLRLVLNPEVKCLKSLLKIHVVVTEVSDHKAKGECESTSYYTGYVLQILSLFLEIINVINFHSDTVQAVTKLPFVYQ